MNPTGKRKWDKVVEGESSAEGSRKDKILDAVEVAKKAASRITAALKVEDQNTISDIQSIKVGDIRSDAPSSASSIGSALANLEKTSELEEVRRREQAITFSHHNTIEINDHRHRYYLIKNETRREIEEVVGVGKVVITADGKYYPDRSLYEVAVTKSNIPPPPPLSLKISAISQDYLDEAIIAVKQCMEVGPRPSNILPKSTAAGYHRETVKVFAPFDPMTIPASFNLRQKILGPQGSYLRHINNETGIRVNLRGRKSGHVEIGKREDQLEPLHLLLEGDKPEAMEYAKLLCEDLFETINEEIETSKAPPVISPMPPYGQFGYPYPVGYPYYGQQPPDPSTQRY